MRSSKLVVTGAAGFLGRRVVLHALERGHRVTAIVRPDADGATGDGSAPPGSGDERVDVVPIDLAGDAGPVAQALRAALRDASAVVHCAARMSGDDAAQQRETLEPTRRLLEAMAAMREQGGAPPRLVLVSSLAVYGYEALPAGTTLDETTPLEGDPSLRDAYCRAKLGQEALALHAAQRDGLEVRVMRPGVIHGPGRLWTARLGVLAGPLLLQLGRHARLPLCDVESCAEALVLAAERPVEHSDLAEGRLEAIDVLDDDETTQQAWLALIRRAGAPVPAIALPLPWGLLSGLSRAIAGLALLFPALVARLPAPLRPPSLHARAKPLRYSNARLRERLGWQRRAATEEAVLGGAAGADSRP